MKKKSILKLPRNQYVVLRHILNNECIPALEVLCRLQKEEKEFISEVKNNPATARRLGDVPILKTALICLLCVRITNIFADNRGISFKDFEIELKKNKIVKDMIRTRQTWFGHIGKEINHIVSAEEICESDLQKRLENILSVLMMLYFERK